MLFSLNDLVWGLLAPLLLAAILRLGLAALADRWRPQRKPTEAPPAEPSYRRVFAWETCLPYAAGAAVGYFVLQLGPFWPEAPYQWLPAAVALATVVECLADLVPGPVWLQVGVRLLLSLATTAVAGYLLMPTWEGLVLPYPMFLGAWGATAGLLVLAVDLSRVPQLPDRAATWSWSVVVWGTCLATAGVVVASESLLFTKIGGLAFSVTLGIAVAGMLRREAWLPKLGLPLGVHLAGILLVAQTYSYSAVPWLSYGLPLMGMLMALIGAEAIPRKVSAVPRAGLVILMAAIPATIAVILAALAG